MVCTMLAAWTVRMFNSFRSFPICKEDMENMATYLCEDLEQIAKGKAGLLRSDLELEDDDSHLVQKLTMALGAIERDFYWFAYRPGKKSVKSESRNPPRTIKSTAKKRELDDLEEQRQTLSRKRVKLSPYFEAVPSSRYGSSDSALMPSPTKVPSVPKFKKSTNSGHVSPPKPATKKLSPKKSPAACGEVVFKAKAKQPLLSPDSGASPHWARTYEENHLGDLRLVVGEYNNIFDPLSTRRARRPPINILAEAILERVPGHRSKHILRFFLLLTSSY